MDIKLTIGQLSVVYRMIRIESLEKKFNVPLSNHSSRTNSSVVVTQLFQAIQTHQKNIAVSTTPISQGHVDLPVIKESNNTVSSTSSSTEPVSTTSGFFIDGEYPIEEDNHPSGEVSLLMGNIQLKRTIILQGKFLY